MSLEKVKKVLKEYGLEDRLIVFDSGTETVEKAAEQIDCQPAEIAKSMAFEIEDRSILILAAGDIRIDNRKYKEEFGKKAKMIKKEDLLSKIGYPMGGVCPFDVNEGVEVYMDESLKKFNTLYPAGGTDNSVVKMKIEDLSKIIKPIKWIDVGKEV